MGFGSSDIRRREEKQKTEKLKTENLKEGLGVGLCAYFRVSVFRSLNALLIISEFRDFLMSLHQVTAVVVVAVFPPAFLFG